jgi:hypothetical protein
VPNLKFDAFLLSLLFKRKESEFYSATFHMRNVGQHKRK